MNEPKTETALAVSAPKTAGLSVFGDMQSFTDAQRIAKCLSASDIVPESYRGEKGLANTLVAMELSNRMGVSVFAIMQNMVPIQGRPSFASTFIIASINSSGRFGSLKWRITPLGRKTVERVEIDDVEFVAYATELTSGETVEGPPVSYEMAVREGWWTKPRSKWQTMPKTMGMYRAAAFFARVHCPELINGMQAREEVEDVIDVAAEPVRAVRAKPAPVVSDLDGAMAAAEPAKPEPKPKAERKPKDAPVVVEVPPAKAPETVEVIVKSQPVQAPPHVSQVNGTQDDDFFE